MENKKIIVTGGAGFLGSHVVKLLLEKDYHVVIVDDFSNGKMLHLKNVENNPHLKIISANITNKNEINDAFTDCKIIIHLAVLCLRESIRDPHHVNDVIVNGTLNCLDLAKENNVELFLNCSSSEVYGSAKYIPMNEDHPLQPETPYAASKVAQDMLVFSYGRTYGLPWTTIRPFNMYGPNSHWQGYRGELIPKMIVRAMNNEPLVIFGEGNQTRDFLYVEDAAKALLSVVENQSCLNRSINFCTGRETSIRRIAELICKEFSLNIGQYIINQPSRPGDVMRHLGDNSKFEEIFGYTSLVNIEEGIHKTIKWMKQLPFSADELKSQEKIKNWI